MNLIEARCATMRFIKVILAAMLILSLIEIAGATFTTNGTVGWVNTSNSINGLNTTIDLGDDSLKVGNVADNLNDANYDGWWLPSVGTISVANGYFEQTNDASEAWQTQGIVYNYTFEDSDFYADVRIDDTTGTGYVAIAFSNMTDPDNIASDISASLRLESPDKIQSNNIGQTPYDISYDIDYSTWYNLKLSKDNGIINISVNGVDVLNFSDANWDIPVNSISLHWHTSKVSFDNIRIVKHGIFSGERIAWYDSGIGNEVYLINITAKGNYTLGYGDNSTRTISENITYLTTNSDTWNNQSYVVTGTKYQDAFLNVTSLADSTSSPSLIEVSMYEQLSQSYSIATTSDLMFLVNESETWQFQSGAVGNWTVNKVLQSNVTENFNWTVPTKDIYNRPNNIYEIRFNNSTTTIEWVVSTLNSSEAPDIFESFTDANFNGSRTELDPWGRTVSTWLVNKDTYGNDGILNTSEKFVNISLGGMVLNSSNWTGTLAFDFYPSEYGTQPYNQVIFWNSSNRLYSITDYIYYKFGYGDNHFFTVDTSYSTDLSNYSDPGAAYHLFKTNFDDASTTQFVLGYSWYRLIIVMKPYSDTLTQLQIYESYDGVDGYTYTIPASGAYINRTNNAALEFGIATAGLVKYDNIKYFKDYYYDGRNISYDGSEIIVKGSNLTLQTINDSINNESLFIYYTSNNTAYSYKNLSIDGDTTLSIINETLLMANQTNIDLTSRFFDKYNAVTEPDYTGISTGTSKLIVQNSTINSISGTYDLLNGQYSEWNITDSTLDNISSLSSPGYGAKYNIINSTIKYYTVLNIGTTEMDRYSQNSLIDNSTFTKYNPGGSPYTFADLVLKDGDDSFYHKTSNTLNYRNPVIKNSNFTALVGYGGASFSIQNVKVTNWDFISWPVGVEVNGGSFRPYYYSDINITDSSGNAISGATITITNNVNSDYPSRDYNGNNVTSFVTGEDGHTPLPSNESNTIVLAALNSWNTGGTRYHQDFNYTVSVSCDNCSGDGITYITNSSVVITPDSSWYRPDPNTHQNTTQITLSELAVNTPPTAPTLTSNLNMSEVNHNPTITFTKGTDADNDTVTTYIYVDATNPPTTQETFTTANNTTIGITTPLLDGITYYVRARSWDGTNWSGYSDIDTFRMAGSAVPFTFSNTTLSETQIYQSSGVEDISVDINSSLGTISGATVTITYLSVDFIYAMTQGSGDTWTYSFKTSATGTYTVKEFNATDSASNTDGDTWGTTFTVVPVVPGGSSGATAPNITATPTPTPAGQNVTASIPLLSMSNPISELNKAIIKTATIPENPTLKWMFVTFMTLFGVVLCVGVVLVKGQKVGKFSKPSALMMGMALIGLGLYLA